MLEKVTCQILFLFLFCKACVRNPLTRVWHTLKVAGYSVYRKQPLSTKVVVVLDPFFKATPELGVHDTRPLKAKMMVPLKV